METITINLEALLEQHKGLIHKTIWRNRSLLAALRVEDEDVAQQLAIAMVTAIRRFDPDRSASLAAHIWCSLQYEILNIKRRHKPHGITGIPKGCRLDFLYLDDAHIYALASEDDMSGLEMSELLESLTETEVEALDLRVQGYPIRRKVHISALEGVRNRCAEMYAIGV